jgi:hypothetical protein
MFRGTLIQIYFLLWAKNRIMKQSNEHPEKMGFHHIQDLIQRSQLQELGRDSVQEKFYQTRRAELAEIWENPSDCILHEKFHLAYDITMTGKRQISRPLPRWTTGLIKTVPNDFPYNFETDVLHLVLWKIGEPVSQNDALLEIEKLQQQYSFRESCWFINPPHLKSILDIDHAHIILQMNQTPAPSSPPLTSSQSISSSIRERPR